MNHILAKGLGDQFSPLTTFLHTVPTIVIYLVAFGLFLVLAKMILTQAEKKGGKGLAFRHIITGFGFGLLGALIILPASIQTSVSKLGHANERLTLDMVLGLAIVFEIVMIIRDRRKGGGE